MVLDPTTMSLEILNIVLQNIYEAIGDTETPNIQQVLNQGRNYDFTDGFSTGRWRVMADNSGGIGIYEETFEIESGTTEVQISSRKIGNGFAGNSVRQINAATEAGTQVVVGAEVAVNDARIVTVSYADDQGETGSLQIILDIPEVGDQGRYIFRRRANSAAVATLEDIPDYNDRFKGKYTSIANLQAAHPTASDGDYAIVDAGTGSNAKEYIWDAQEGWVISGSAGAASTDALPEGSINLYFTSARVIATILSGLSLTTGGTISSGDSVLQAFGKLQYQITNVFGGFAAFLTALSAITTPADTDEYILQRSGNSRKVLWSTLKSSLRSYFNGYYSRTVYMDTGVYSTTATLSPQIFASRLVSANDIQAGRLRMRKTWKRTNANANITVDIYINTSISISGATKLATITIANTGLFSVVDRELSWNGTTLKGFPPAINSPSDDAINGNTPLSAAIDFAGTAYYIFDVATLNNTSDVLETMDNELTNVKNL
ncbi:hypothetical protein [Flavobacterium sp.]|uniref:hypothetical protein n=1 Tax=Flavobacterium sp. TaxID=239 RepID=UPI001210449B|nr:hypothetical protein [Flavobacterium sp.]RZJ71080.1 MAG: hypothetical protein EOO49_11545 [Flavobacterium sp.]